MQHLSKYADRFVGRSDDLTALSERFGSGARLVTVLGPPGVGKTRLAWEYARRLHANEARAHFCDLAEVRAPDEILAAVARALAVHLSDGVTRANAVAQLGRALGGRGRALLVLDNFDELTAFAAELLLPWLAAAPDACLLVTSRELLRLRDEHVLELSPLRVPEPGVADVEAFEAVELLVDRVRRRDRGFCLTGTVGPVVAEIVRQLDGIPLAIEFAAGRIASLDARAVLERLPSRFDVLARRTHGAAAHHQTLRAAIDWSWDHLDADERSTLAQCAVFRGGFTLEAVERVVAAPRPDAAPILEIVQALRDRSLVYRDARDPPRYGMYLSIRAYAEERLREAGEDGAAEQRHARYYVALAEGLAEGSRGRDGIADLARLGPEQENLSAAVQRSLGGQPRRRDAIALALALRGLAALEPLVRARGPWDPYLATFDEAIAAAGSYAIEPVILAEALATRGEARRCRGRLDESATDLDAALILARGADSARLLGRVLQRRGMTAIAAHRAAEAKAYFVEALPLHREAGDEASEAGTLAGMGNVEHLFGRFEDARAYGRQAMALLGPRAAPGILLGNLAIVCLDLGHFDEAGQAAEQQLVMCREVGGAQLEMHALGILGWVAQGQGRLEDAAVLLARAAQMAREQGHRRSEGIYGGYLGTVRLEQGEPEAAAACFRGARRAIEEAAGLAAPLRGEDRLYVALFSGYAAVAVAWLGRLDEAGGTLVEATALIEGTRHHFADVVLLQRGHVDLGRARAAEARGDAGAANALLQAATSLLEEARAAAARSPGHPAGTLPFDLRIATRILERALARRFEAPAPPPPPSLPAPPAPDVEEAPALVVHPDGAWFRLPAGRRVDCGHRPILCALLAALAARRLDAPRSRMTAKELIDVGWPGERALPQAANNRVRVALTRLRRLGLGDLLLSDARGYFLDPSVPVRIAR